MLQKDILAELHICDTTLRKALKPLSWDDFRQKILKESENVLESQ